MKIKNILLGCLFLLVLPSFAQKHLEILHTNDTHSCIMPLSKNLADTMLADRGGYTIHKSRIASTSSCTDHLMSTNGSIRVSIRIGCRIHRSTIHRPVERIISGISVGEVGSVGHVYGVSIGKHGVCFAFEGKAGQEFSNHTFEGVYGIIQAGN